MEEQHAYVGGPVAEFSYAIEGKTVRETEMMRLPLVPHRRENPLFMGYNFLRR